MAKHNNSVVNFNKYRFYHKPEFWNKVNLIFNMINSYLIYKILHKL